LERLETSGGGLTVRVSILSIVGVHVASVVSTVQECGVVIDVLAFRILVLKGNFVVIADV
jgi:hypothetical protein